MGNYLSTVVNCSACGQTHARLEFKALTYPVSDQTGEVWTHMAVCPVTGKTIFERVGAPPLLADPDQDLVC